MQLPSILSATFAEQLSCVTKIITVGNDVFSSNAASTFMNQQSIVPDGITIRFDKKDMFAAKNYVFYAFNSKNIAKFCIDDRSTTFIRLPYEFVRFIISGDFLFVGDENGMIHQYNIADTTFVRSYVKHTYMVHDMIVYGNYLFSSCAGYRIYWWNIVDGRLMISYMTSHPPESMFADGEYLYLMSYNYICRLSLDKDSEPQYYFTHRDKLIAIYDRGDEFISICSHIVCKWKKSGETIFQLNFGDNLLQTAYNGKYIIVAAENHIWQILAASMKLIGHISLQNTKIKCLCIDGEILYVGCEFLNGGKICKMRLSPFEQLRQNWPLFSKDEKRAIIFLTVILAGLNKNVLGEVLAAISIADC